MDVASGTESELKSRSVGRRGAARDACVRAARTDGSVDDDAPPPRGGGGGPGAVREDSCRGGVAEADTASRRAGRRVRRASRLVWVAVAEREKRMHSGDAMTSAKWVTTSALCLGGFFFFLGEVFWVDFAGSPG